jgi:hypothetical protein
MVFQGSSSAAGGPVAASKLLALHSSQRAERGYHSQHHGRRDGNGGERQFVGVSAVRHPAVRPGLGSMGRRGPVGSGQGETSLYVIRLGMAGRYADTER